MDTACAYLLRPCLLLFAFSAEVCSGQGSFGQIGQSQNQQSVGFNDPFWLPQESLLCPTMGNFQKWAKLNVEPFTFLRTIDVQAPQAGFQNSAWQNGHDVGVVKSIFFAWTAEYGLYKPDVDGEPDRGKLMAKIVNPAGFWDKTQDVYNCKDAKIAVLENEENLWDTIRRRYAKHKIYDGAKNWIGYLVPEEGKYEVVGTSQHVVTLFDRQGRRLASMKHRTKGWGLFFLEDFEVELEFHADGVLTPPYPVMDSAFMSLVFANQLAMSFRTGPVFSAVFLCLFLFVGLPCMVFLCCRRPKFCHRVCCCLACIPGFEDCKKCCCPPPPPPKEEEVVPLVYSTQAFEETRAQNRGVFGCCSRRSVPLVAPR